MKHIRLPLSILATAAAIGLSPVAAQEIAWDMPNEYGETSISGEADKVFAERLEANSGGRIVITNHFGGSLGFKSKDHWSAVEDQAVPLASTYTGVFTGFDPIFLMNNLPFVATNPVQSKALIDAARPYYAGAFEKGNQLLLLTEPWSPVGIWSKKQINSAAEMQGLKIRTYDKNGTLTLKELGAAAIQMSWADVVPALSTNTIEAVLTSEEGGLSAKFQEYLDHFHYVNFTMGSNMVHINKDVFNALPDDLQKIVLDTAAEVEDELWSKAQDRIDLNVKRLAEAKVTAITDVPASFIDELKGAAQVAIDEWRAQLGDKKADEILAAYAKQLEKVGQ
ncbi:TRAP transporter substrate-binding protein [Pelagibius sp. Alg239-R121]|uniref:TRAP transporter substrate-binding protein n=1 Tax=Pelagibius sp. Alg239-R121 TaxID=2993448 RepID=UPI0024A63703|nr:TRAP transporter substrate-binding protein [Pelagibius sp. Alg239-R121]